MANQSTRDWLRKFPRHLRSENDIDRFSSISHSARSAMSPIEIIVVTTRALPCLSPPAPSARQDDQSKDYRDHRENAEQGPKHGTRLPHALTPSSHAARV
jgi:hypothetical protein